MQIKDVKCQFLIWNWYYINAKLFIFYGTNFDTEITYPMLETR